MLELFLAYAAFGAGIFLFSNLVLAVLIPPPTAADRNAAMWTVLGVSAVNAAAWVLIVASWRVLFP